MEGKLKYIFEMVNNWLNFAEAKNAALLAMSLAFIMGIYSTNLMFVVPELCTGTIVLNIIAIILVLLSFVPTAGKKKISILKWIDDLVVNWYRDKRPNQVKKNLLFYANLLEYRMEDVEYQRFIDDMKARYNITANDINEREALDFAEEIIINAYITIKKYGYFHLAISCEIISVLLFVVVAIIA